LNELIRQFVDIVAFPLLLHAPDKGTAVCWTANAPKLAPAI